MDDNSGNYIHWPNAIDLDPRYAIKEKAPFGALSV